MKFLIDVCVGVFVAEDLVGAGHDVVQVRDIDKCMADEQVLEKAQREQRTLITIDKDFGALIFREGLRHAGVLRLPDVRRAERVAIVRNVLGRHEKDLEAGAIITATRHVIRMRRPSQEE